MKNILLNIFILSVILFSITNCKKKNSDILYERDYINEINAIRDEIGLYMATNRVPGATFAVAKEGKIIYSEGFGLASKDLEVPVTRNTKFRIGELSENFTSLLYQKLIKNGTLNPDSTIQYYYPGFPEKKQKITLHHLVQHTSGIRLPNSKEEIWPGLHISLKKGIELFMSDSLIAPPGTYQIQSMFNYNLLGAIIEEVTGKHFNDILKKFVTDTLGLNNTIPDNPFITVPGRADFFEHNMVAQVMPATFRDMRYRISSEGLLSNAEDLVKFGNAMLYSDYIPEDLKIRLFKPDILTDGSKTNMSNGWVILRDHDNRLIYGKNGNVTGGCASLLIYPEEKLVVACATNLSMLTDDLPVFLIAGKFLDNASTEQKNQE